ncbi:LysR family transcriptional regulator [Amycolatopsis carbonis]|uniref:LysR family transcriptional regulator n=1 Tax=Amycolatopsis carbonis TaxID=715471 RepID=A0A9Y2IMK9_9PSEU|nr:LysR family transcriptional regulator [Amycolatopsis sp. 2-15]WIX81786.1 LysR family transcriptional regulator [Amycolatopsis sp. 2-15]
MDVHGRDLRYFVTVAEELHFTRAAERLYVSQPALSKQIRVLERQLGAPLFDRDRREVRLTPVGEALLPHARRVLAEWDAAHDAVTRAKAEQRGTLVVGMSTSPGRGGMLPAIRSRFTDEHPHARVTLRQVGWHDSTAGLADGSTDVAFVWLPVPGAERYRWIVVAEEPRLVAMSAAHRLAGESTVDFADLLDEPFLALPADAGPLRDYWLAPEARGGRSPVIGAEIGSADETYEALVDGLGVCLIAAGNAPLLTRGDVVALPVRGVSPSRLALAWRKDDTRPLVHAYANAARLATRP